MKKPSLFYLIVLINLGGTVYGIYYYHLQLLEYPFYMWPIISDSPNSTLAFAVAFLLLYRKKSKDIITIFAGASLIKYGLWTDFVLLFHSGYFFSPERMLLYTGIFITHTAMVVEGIPLAATVRNMGWRVYAVLLWFLINDGFDYLRGTHPYIPQYGIETVALVTVLLSFISLILVWLSHWRCKMAEPANHA
jgi:uncharacterized membrane protein YpjA